MGVKCRADSHPAADIRRALQKARPKQHRPALPPAEVPELLARLKVYEGDELTKLALQFTLITMVRTQETRFANLREFEGLDGDQPLWRLSPVRMKMNREHLVPLPRADFIDQATGEGSATTNTVPSQKVWILRPNLDSIVEGLDDAATQMLSPARATS